MGWVGLFAGQWKRRRSWRVVVCRGVGGWVGRCRDLVVVVVLVGVGVVVWLLLLLRRRRELGGARHRQSRRPFLFTRVVKPKRDEGIGNSDGG